ncbi:MAG: TIGR01777 family protein [Phycisphaerales bacterium]|nr:TIGR01777 family protein [Phycisphaerales bacterium]
MPGNETFIFRSRIPAAAGEVFAWHERPGAFERLTPPFEHVTLAEMTDGIRDGSRVTLKIRNGPLRLTWVARHSGFVPGRSFVDTQERGPFARWVHTHRFIPDGGSAMVMEDHVEYRPPLGWLGRVAGGGVIRRKLGRMFGYRHRVLAGDIAAHAAWRGRPRLHVILTGASGFLGSALAAFLTTGGHAVSRLVRSNPDPARGRYLWRPDQPDPGIDPALLASADAVVHLSGEPLIGGRWTPAKARRVRESRVATTAALARAVAATTPSPRVFVSASGTGFYGDRGEAELDESADAGSGFLAELCRDWESAAKPAAEQGVRTVQLRIGAVLSPDGGILRGMGGLLRVGLAGPLGHGRQRTGWISLDDTVGAILHVLMRQDLQGPVNLCAPECPSNREFVRAIGRAIHRPAVMPMPAWALRLMFGQPLAEGALASARVIPRELTESGYTFRHPTLDGTLAHVLGIA